MLLVSLESDKLFKHAIAL